MFDHPQDARPVHALKSAPTRVHVHNMFVDDQLVEYGRKRAEEICLSGAEVNVTRHPSWTVEQHFSISASIDEHGQLLRVAVDDTDCYSGVLRCLDLLRRRRHYLHSLSAPG